MAISNPEARAFEAMLTGGHPNSLGRTLEVVEAVLADRDKLDALFDTYRSDDAVVRLRVSNAIKRVEVSRHDWLVPFIDRLLGEVGALDQPSAQWTLAQLFQRLARDMTADQRAAAAALLKRNLESGSDWIVLAHSMTTLADWARANDALADWLRPHLARLSRDSRKSVAGKAGKLMSALG